MQLISKIEQIENMYTEKYTQNPPMEYLDLPDAIDDNFDQVLTLMTPLLFYQTERGKDGFF